MMSNRSLCTLAVAALTLSGIACSVSPSSGGAGGASSGTGGASATATGGAGSGGVTSTGGKVGSGGSASGGSGGGGNGGDGSGGAATGGASSGGAGSGGAAGSSSSGGASGTGGSAGNSGSGRGGAGTGGATGTATGGTLGNTGGSSGVAGSGTGGLGKGGSGTGGSGTGGSGTAGSGTGGSGGGMGGSTSAGSPGCGKTPTLTSGSRTIQSSGSSRSFMLRIPANYDNSHPYPLVFAFHWNGGTMNDIDGGGSSGYTWSYYGLREQADNSTNAKMIFVAPQGNGNGWANSNGQDLTLVDDMLKQLEGDLCVDTTRIFAMGFSYGGGMSYAIACARATVFRAVAVYSGAQLSGCTGGNDPIAYLGIHGIGDTTCNISGGRSLRDKFVKNNTCTAQNPPEPSSGSGKHTCSSYAGCSSGHPVRWCAFDGGHTPGNVDGGGDDGAKTWTKGESWQFFTQF